jgi:hypothetical protein
MPTQASHFILSFFEKSMERYNDLERIKSMKPVSEWDEEYLLSLPLGEFDWFEAKGRKALDLTLPEVDESKVLDTLAKAISALANSGGGQLVFGLKNPSRQMSTWLVDDGAISTSVKGKTSTKEWLENVIPNLVEFPLTQFNVYPIKSSSGESQILPDRALYVVDIADSSNAPHQSKRDSVYYARVGGKSCPISHRMIMDIVGRRQYPKIELKFEIERKFIKGQPSERFPFAYLNGTKPPEKDTNTYTLQIRAKNTGRVYAQYVNSFILIPVELLSRQQVKVFGVGRLEKTDGKSYIRYYKDNTIRDAIGSSGFRTEYGPSRYDPILPGLSHQWEITLQRDNKNLKNDDLSIKWTAYADNAPPNSGEINVKNISIVDTIEPDFSDMNDDDE